MHIYVWVHQKSETTAHYIGRIFAEYNIIYMEAEEETKNFLVGVCDSIMGLMPDWVQPVLEVTNEFFGFVLDAMDASAQRLQGAILCTIIALPVIANPRAMEVALAGGGTTRFSTGGTIMFAGLLAANGGGGSGGGNNENETFSERSSGGGKKPVNRPSSKKVEIDMEEVVSGHTLNGSRAKQSKIKDLFPDNMSTKDIEKEIREAYGNAKQVGSPQFDGKSTRIKLQGQGRNGVVEMWYNKDTKKIETAYPIDGKKVKIK